MDQLFQIPNTLKNTTFLLDTNFFIDSYSHPAEFQKFITSLKKANIELVSTSFVKFEFVRSKTIDVVHKKLRYFEEIVATLLPFDSETENLILSIFEEYKQFMEGVPFVDLILGAYLKRYKNLYLLTRDHLDFPTTIFDRIQIFNVELVREIKPYGVYTYKPKEQVLKEKIPF